ncbi:uncharacterized protein LOC142230334 [Haematobia irritans]|uniref:uncharacterized protein LOC142230334 n=1 Tax=Haematobia irritans TaxID=7368 RepID=UPI003F5066F9
MATKAKKLSSRENRDFNTGTVTSKNNGGIPKRANAKPLVLSSQRYNKIVTNAIPMEKLKTKQQLEEQKYQEQLKIENDKLVAQFEGNMQSTKEEKIQQLKEQLDKKTQQAKESYEQTKENEAQKRQEKIAKAQKLIEKLKPGPRDLRTAALQSEVLRARNVQREINEEFKKAIKQQECEMKMMCHGQAMSWIQDGQQRLTERQKNENLYKKELLQTIGENQKIRSEQKKQEMKEQQVARQTTDAEIKAQMEKEMAIMEKKREELRKNALEAMKMTEQRRLREQMTEQIEDRLVCVYNAGKRQLNSLLAEQTKKIADEQQRKIDGQLKKLASMADNSQALESERIRRDISTMQLKFTAEEQEKIRKDKAAKQARIEAYLREMEEQKEAKRRAEEEKRFEIAQRFKNEEVNRNFVIREKEKMLDNARTMRSFLDQQIEENQRHKVAEKQANITCHQESVDKEDKFFFEYARNLIEDAQQKGRPLYPFVKAVQQYKKENEINCERKVPPHMATKITIGRTPQPPSKEDKSNGDEKNAEDKTSKVREEILQNCMKIDEIILKAGKDKQIELSDPTPQQGSDICSGGVLTKPLKTESSSNDKCGSTNSIRLRYSMEDLKKLNHYAAPSCH